MRVFLVPFKITVEVYTAIEPSELATAYHFADRPSLHQVRRLCASAGYG